MVEAHPVALALKHEMQDETAGNSKISVRADTAWTTAYLDKSIIPHQGSLSFNHQFYDAATNVRKYSNAYAVAINRTAKLTRP